MAADFLRLGFQNLRRRKLRSWLTMIGIFIGIAAVVSLMSLGQGLQDYINSEFEKLGSDKIIIQPKGMGAPGTAGPSLTLTSDDLNDGYILTCCRSAASDVQLDIENLERLNGIQSKISPCRIDAIKYLNDNVISIILRLPPGNELNYLAGQYIDVISKNGLRRSYSLANSFHSDGKLELYIQKVLDGEMSDYWFNSAKVNDLLRLEGPLGTFCLRPNLPENLIFLSTGTGIAPVKALLEELEANPNLVEKKNIYVYWGGRSETDFYWQPSFENIKLKFIPVLSRSIENWDGRLGYVQQAVIDDSIVMKISAVYA